MIRIDKSAFTPEERAQYEALIAKASVEVEGETPAVEKSASPELTAALAELADLKKSIEMKEFSEIAKKYAPLGKKEEDLAKTLYDLKKSNEANYDAFVGVLDESLGLVEKSGTFSEIGKSAGGSPVNGAEAKAIAKAQEIMKADPTMSYTSAIAKAWEDPTIMAEYDEEYKA